VPLRRNWRFQALWVGGSLANVGVEAVEIAFPLLILAISGSPGLAGLFGFVQVSVMVLATLPAGALVDRWDRRHVLLVTEGVRALAILAVAAGVTFWHVGIGYLIAIAAVLGIATALGGPARMLITRAVVPPEQLTSALAQEEARGGAAALAGPPAGGVLFALSRAVPFLAAGLGFVVSFLCILVAAPNNKPERAAGAEAEAGPVPRRSPWKAFGTVFDGVRFLLAHRTLRSALALISVFYLVVTAAILAVVVELRGQHLSSGYIGLAVSGVACGMLAGSVLVKRLHSILPPGKLLIAASALATIAVGLLALSLGPVWVWAMLFLAALPVPSLRVLVDLLIFRQTPDESKGRAIAATMTIIGIGSPLGSLIAGVTMQFGTVAIAVLTVAALQAVITVAGLLDRQLRTSAWPGN
jgi:MFS family permease